MKYPIRKQQLIARMRKLARAKQRQSPLKHSLRSVLETTLSFDFYRNSLLNEMLVLFVNQPHADDNENTKYQNNIVNMQA